jgi:hypothetical protein
MNLIIVYLLPATCSLNTPKGKLKLLKLENGFFLIA